MSSRPALAAFAASLVLGGGAAGCASTGVGPTGPVGPPPPRIGVVSVDPTSGAVGTLFTLTAKGQRQEETVAFEITFPGEGKAYPGAALAVPADGTATTTYRATTANTPGEYLVRLTGPPGILAEGRFTVTDGPPVTSAMPQVETDGSTSTSGRTATTARSGRTTSTGLRTGSTTSTSARPGLTTTTTRRTTPSSMATTTTPRR